MASAAAISPVVGRSDGPAPAGVNMQSIAQVGRIVPEHNSGTVGAHVECVHDPGTGSGNIRPRLPAGGLHIPAVTLHQLPSARQVTGNWKADAGKAWHENDLVFSTRYGLPLDPCNFHRRFKAQARKAAVPVVSVHSTRRTCASLLVELDVHPRVAMQILRHSRISITMDIYSQVAAASTRDALGRLGMTLVIKS
jgi:hypothetical protein